MCLYHTAENYQDPKFLLINVSLKLIFWLLGELFGFLQYNSGACTIMRKFHGKMAPCIVLNLNCLPSPSLLASQLASQVAELETNSEQIFEEGLAAVRLDCSCDGSPGGCGGAGPDARSAALWGCYLSWALERLEAVGTVRSLRKKVSSGVMMRYS